MHTFSWDLGLANDINGLTRPKLLGLNSYYIGLHRMIFLFRFEFGPLQHIVQGVDSGPHGIERDTRVLSPILVNNRC